MVAQIEPTDRTRLRRRPQRASYDRDVINAILDEAFICHFGFTLNDQPYVIPTAYARAGEVLYVHGSAASRTLREAKAGIPVCLTVTILDGLVLARSAMNHSMNYRSVVVLGTAAEVVEPDVKEEALRVLTEHIVPHRWDDIRPPTDQELKATTVLQLPLQEASAKIRTGPPLDEEEDYALPVWGGVIPVSLGVHPPLPDAYVDGVRVPEYALNYRRPAVDASKSVATSM